MTIEKEKLKAIATANAEKLATIKASEGKTSKIKEENVIPQIVDRERRNEILKNYSAKKK